MRSVIFAFLMYVGLIGGVAADQPKDVSMIQLISDPQRFDGKMIRVIGYLHLEFEGNAIYLHREDFDRAIHQNGLWIELTESQLRTSAKLNNGYVIVEGIFSSMEKGHLGIWPGSIQHVNRLGNWSVDPRRRPTPQR